MSGSIEFFDSCNLVLSGSANQNARLDLAREAPVSMGDSLGLDTRTFVPAIVVLIVAMCSATFFLVYFFRKSLAAQVRRGCSIFFTVVSVVVGVAFVAFCVASFVEVVDFQKDDAPGLNCATGSIPTELFTGSGGFIGLDLLRTLLGDTATGVDGFEAALPALEVFAQSGVAPQAQRAISALEGFRDAFKTTEVEGLFQPEVPATFASLPELLGPALSDLRELSTSSNSAAAALRKLSELSDPGAVARLRLDLQAAGTVPERFGPDFAQQPRDRAVSVQVAVWVLFGMALLSILLYVLSLVLARLGREEKKAFKYSFVLAASFSIFFAAVVVVLQQQNESLKVAQRLSASLLAAPTPSALLSPELAPLAWLFDGCLGSAAPGVVLSPAGAFGAFDLLEVRKAAQRLVDPYTAGLSLSTLSTSLQRLERFQAIDSLALTANLEELNRQTECSGVSYAYAQASCPAYGCVEIGQDAAFVQNACMADAAASYALYQKLATAKQSRVAAYSDAFDSFSAGAASPVGRSMQLSFLKDSLAVRLKDFAASFRDSLKLPVGQWSSDCSGLRPKVLIVEQLLFETAERMDKIVGFFIVAAALMVIGLWAIMLSWVFSGMRSQKVENVFLAAKAGAETENIAQPDKIDQLILKGT